MAGWRRRSYLGTPAFAAQPAGAGRNVNRLPLKTNYVVAGGMPDRRAGHAADVAGMALDIPDVTRKLGIEMHDDLSVRMGIHTGSAVAGVIRTRKLFHDVWGDTVKTASPMESESHGSAGKMSSWIARRADPGHA